MTPSVTSSPTFVRVRVLLLLTFLLVPGTTAHGIGADSSKFPEYRVISVNVAFWQKIYSTHSVNTAIIHDQNYLDRIYAIVKLADAKQPGARSKNEALVERTKSRYAQLLRELARNPNPRSEEQERIAAMFGPSFNPAALKRAAQNIRSQRGLRERFAEGVVRSGAYMSEIKRIFRSFGLPTDLAYLPHVESSFNPAAYSKFGAAGMWQFTRTTGKEFLRIDYIIDERRDPLLSARAAAQFLKRNYQKLGTWPLALTAYNYGPAGVKRAMEQEGSYENIFRNYRKGWFKFASRNFYAEFLAAVRVAKHLERSNQLRLARPARYVSVKLPAFTDAARLCNYLGIDKNELRRYNPALRDPVFQGTKYIPADYVIRLPARFKNNTRLASAPASIFKSAQKRSKFYQVRSGDTAGAIALAHRVSLESLVRVNNLNRQAMIRVGQNLRIPPANGTSTAKTSTRSQLAEALTLQDSKKTSASEPVLALEAVQGDNVVVGNLKVFNIQKRNQLLSGTVVVQPDESIGLFADWLKVTRNSIRVMNRLPARGDVHPGQQIVLDFLRTSIETFEETRFDFHQEIQEDFFNSYAIVGVKTYRVEDGDTIWDICRNKFGIPLWLLQKYNDELNLNHLDSASTLQIPILEQI